MQNDAKDVLVANTQIQINQSLFIVRWFPRGGILIIINTVRTYYEVIEVLRPHMRANTLPPNLAEELKHLAPDHL